MQLDDIYRVIGEFGAYQKCLYLVLGLCAIPTGWQNVAITFMGADMDHWCYVDELANFTYDQQKYIAIPMDNNGHDSPHYSQCTVFDLDYGNFTEDDLDKWNRSSMINSSTPTKQCSSWVYDRSIFESTLVNQFGLVCDKAWLLPVVQTIYMTGVLVGNVVFGQLADRRGRKPTLIATLALQVVFGVAAAMVPNFIAFCAFRFFVGACAGAAFTIAFVVCMETIGPKWRMELGIWYQGWFALGIMSLSLFSYYVRSAWKFQLILAVGVIPQAIACIWLVPESPRWLISKELDEKAEQYLAIIAKVNGTVLPENLDLSENRRSQKDKEKQSTIINLLKTPRLRHITLGMWSCWKFLAVMYYGLSLGVSILSGDLFLDNFLTGVVELPSYVLACFGLNLIGRKIPLVSSLLLGGVFCLASLPLFNAASQTALTVFLMTGKFFGAAAFAVLYVYAAELFPTVVRNVGLGSCSTSARLGSLIQPQIALLSQYWAPAPFAAYGAMSMIGGFISLTFPETRKRKLPETLEEAENFGRDRPGTVEDTSMSYSSFVNDGRQDTESTRWQLRSSLGCLLSSICGPREN